MSDDKLLKVTSVFSADSIIAQLRANLKQCRDDHAACQERIAELEKALNATIQDLHWTDKHEGRWQDCDADMCAGVERSDVEPLAREGD